MCSSDLVSPEPLELLAPWHAEKAHDGANTAACRRAKVVAPGGAGDPLVVASLRPHAAITTIAASHGRRRT